MRYQFLAALVVPMLCAQAVAEPAGGWPMWRHDSRLTGYQPLPGGMRQAPRVVAKHFLGASPGTRMPADLRVRGKQDEILVCARGRLSAFDAAGKPMWTSDAAGYDIAGVQWLDDLDGGGRTEIVAVAGHVGGTRQAYVVLDGPTGKSRGAIDIVTGDFGFVGMCGAYVPGSKGKQVFVVTSCRQGEAGPSQNGEFALWTFDGTKVSRAWSYVPPEFTIFYPAVLVGELAKGKMFGVVNSWCHVWSIDLATGRIASHEAWDAKAASPRHYGWNELIDVDGDGLLDYVNLSLTKHVDVLRNDGTGKLKLAWSHGWTDAITTEQRSLRPISNCVVDVDGDGKLEVIGGLFDGLGDKRWRLYVWDAVSGALKAETQDVAPLATAAVWGEGKPRALLCARSGTVQFEQPDALEAWVLRNGKLEKLWTAPVNTRLQTTPVPSSERRNANATGLLIGDPVTADCDGDGGAEFVTVNFDGSAPKAWGVAKRGDTFIEKPAPSPAPAPAATTPAPTLPDLAGNTIPHLLAADVDGNGRNEILLFDNANVTALALDGGNLRTVRTTMSTELPIVGDFTGDGRPVMITGGRVAPNGDLYVEALGPDGKPLWRYVFPDSTGCGQYTDRPHYFAAGHFTGGKHLDVFTYSGKPQARTYVLDGRTGKPVWTQEEVPNIQRHFQAFGGRASAYDINGDGADDAFFLNPDYYCVADGRTGKLLAGPTEITSVVGWWAAYPSPAILRPKDSSQPFVYLGGAYSSRCAVSLDGKQKLFKEYLATERWPLAVDSHRFVEGLLPPSKASANWRVAHVEADGLLLLFQADTGKHLWQMPLGTGVSAIVSGDVDGDGEPELLFGGRDGTLYCVGDGGDKPRVLWKLPFDAPVASVLLADVDADGKSEIVASVADGNVYVLDAAQEDAR
jgi:hypothetical protein